MDKMKPVNGITNKIIPTKVAVSFVSMNLNKRYKNPITQPQKGMNNRIFNPLDCSSTHFGNPMSIPPCLYKNYTTFKNTIQHL
jgi:hypothetical protein